METIIRRIIAEDYNGICILNNPLVEPTTEEELRSQFKKQKLPPIASFTVDSVGTAVIKFFAA